MSILLPLSLFEWHSCRGGLNIWKPRNLKFCTRGQAAPSHLCCCSRSSSLSISPLSLLSSEPSTTAISPDLLQEQGRQGEEREKTRGRDGGRSWRVREGALTFQTAHVLALIGLIGLTLIFILVILHTRRTIETDNVFLFFFNAITYRIIKYQLSLNSIFDEGYCWLKDPVWIVLVKPNWVLLISINCHVRTVLFWGNVLRLLCSVYWSEAKEKKRKNISLFLQFSTIQLL